jgi:hypothetical protein
MFLPNLKGLSDIQHDDLGSKNEAVFGDIA